MPNSVEMRILLIASLLFCGSANAAETIAIPWNGEFAHNSNHHWSAKDEHYSDSGFSKFFKNGTPEENHVVEKNGELKAEVMLPKDAKEPVPFVLILHERIVDFCGGRRGGRHASPEG